MKLEYMDPKHLHLYKSDDGHTEHTMCGYEILLLVERRHRPRVRGLNSYGEITCPGCIPLAPRFRLGQRIWFFARRKAEHGSTGIVREIQYDDEKYGEAAFYYSVEWDGGFLNGVRAGATRFATDLKPPLDVCPSCGTGLNVSCLCFKCRQDWGKVCRVATAHLKSRKWTDKRIANEIERAKEAAKTYVSTSDPAAVLDRWIQQSEPWP